MFEFDDSELNIEERADDFIPIACHNCGAIVDCYMIGNEITGFCHECGEEIKYELMNIQCPVCKNTTLKWVNSMTIDNGYVTIDCKFCQSHCTISGSLLKNEFFTEGIK